MVQDGHKKEQDKYRSRRITAPPSEMSSVDSLSLMSGTTGGGGGVSKANRGPPPPYRFSPRSLPMSPSSETSRDTNKRTFPRISKSSSNVDVIQRSSSGASSSGQARAVHARAAARDAQLSAERALAAAAAASRAADAAAQAATEAEAEADAELGIVADKPSLTVGSLCAPVGIGSRVVDWPGSSTTRNDVMSPLAIARRAKICPPLFRLSIFFACLVELR